MNYIDPVRDALIEQLPHTDEDLLDLCTLLALVRPESVTREDVHDAWAVWKRRTRPDHHSLIPFDQLSPEVQALDEKYVQAIKTAAKAAVH